MACKVQSEARMSTFPTVDGAVAHGAETWMRDVVEARESVITVWRFLSDTSLPIHASWIPLSWLGPGLWPCDGWAGDDLV